MENIKRIGKSGQISLGKQFAGRSVLVDLIDEGVWIVKLGQFIPDSEHWLHSSQISSEVDDAISWAEQNPPKSSNLDDLGKKIRK